MRNGCTAPVAGFRTFKYLHLYLHKFAHISFIPSLILTISCSAFLSQPLLGAESFLGGTSAIHHATPGKGTKTRCTTTNCVYRKWVCGTTTAKAFELIAAHTTQPVLLTQSTQQQKFPKTYCGRRTELRQVLRNIPCVLHIISVRMCVGVFMKEKWNNSRDIQPLPLFSLSADPAGNA